MPGELVLDFSQIGARDVGRVGGKNASLGELYNALRSRGIGAVDGFATTSDFYRKLLGEKDLAARLARILSGFDIEDTVELAKRGQAARTAILETPLPAALEAAVEAAYARLVERLGREPELAVRSSATAEDLPGASFAGQQETFLNVRGRDALVRSVLACIASLFTDRAISYRQRAGFDHASVALSVGVQPMVRSDIASSGVIFTLDPDSGFRDVVVVSSSWGLGEAVVQGLVTPDEWTVFKPTLANGYRPIVGRKLGTKELKITFGDGTRPTRSEPVAAADRARFSIDDEEVLELARWAAMVEEHYSKIAGHPQPMDLEWAKDGNTGRLFIVQARPETVHSAKPRGVSVDVHTLTEAPPAPLVRGVAVGEKIGAGRVRVARDAKEAASIAPGDVLVAPITDPDWEPVMKRVAAIVTDHGGRTAHAAIISREFGIPCVVGTGNGTSVLQDGQPVTVVCSEGPEGRVYPGKLAFETRRVDASSFAKTRTPIMLIVGDPERAFAHAALPSSGVGLARLEFIINNHIGVHPMALARYPHLRDAVTVAEIGRRIGDMPPHEFFIRKLAEGTGRIAAAFYPKPVIVRLSDFKTNEYAKLTGGEEFEPEEENPMIGFRGASRYDDPRYRDGFALECAAMRRVRQDMGLTNVKLMVPFCRTVAEGKAVVAAMARNGLEQGRSGLEIYAMCEVPSNALLADEFLEVFDGFSIGSNDLTQLTLGIDRDSATVAKSFDERNGAVKALIEMAIDAAKRAGKKIGVCGQAPSDYPDFAAWLVERGIDSISLNPDAAVRTARAVAEVEGRLAPPAKRGEGLGGGTPPLRDEELAARS
jgi:pyruvate,water dikinase